MVCGQILKWFSHIIEVCVVEIKTLNYHGERTGGGKIMQAKKKLEELECDR